MDFLEVPPDVALEAFPGIPQELLLSFSPEISRGNLEIPSGISPTIPPKKFSGFSTCLLDIPIEIIWIRSGSLLGILPGISGVSPELSAC